MKFQHTGFMSTHTNRLNGLTCVQLALGLFLFTLGVAESNAFQKSQEKTKAYFTYVLEKDRKPIQRFLKPKSGEVLYLFFGEKLYKDETTKYVVVYSSSKSKCVLYAFTNGPDVSSVTNYGYGNFQKGKGWVINPEDPETGEMFESHGGLFTYERLKDVMKIGLDRGKLISVNWK